MNVLLVLTNQAGDELGRLTLPTVICVAAGESAASSATLPVSAQMPALYTEVQTALAKEGLVCIHDAIDLARAVSQALLQPITAADIQIVLPVQEARPHEEEAAILPVDVTVPSPLRSDGAVRAASAPWEDLFDLAAGEEHHEPPH